jgi:protein-disulfide isomerase
MPRRNRNIARQRSTKPHTVRYLIIASIVIGIAVLFLVLALHPQTSPSDVTFRAREMGDSGAKVVVEEFADFQCPYCRVFSTTIEPRLRTQYIPTGRVRFIFRNYVVVGPESTLAANAVLCAGDQDAFWEYHDLLYANQGAENSGAFSTPRLEAFAAQLHLDGVKFDQCLTSQAHADVIAADTQQGHRYGIPGTPSFAVNGRLVTISLQDTQYQALFSAIDKALAQ